MRAVIVGEVTAPHGGADRAGARSRLARDGLLERASGSDCPADYGPSSEDLVGSVISEIREPNEVRLSAVLWLAGFPGCCQARELELEGWSLAG